MELKDEKPGFDTQDYEFPCQIPGCDGRVLFHFSNVHRAPKSNGFALHVLSKCTECGRTYNFEPAITEEEKDYLEELWNSRQFYPWSDEHGEGIEEMKEVYNDEEEKKIKGKLKELGYF